MNEKETQVNPVALVTGAARRVGAAIVKQLHTAGYDVMVHCHHSKQEAAALVEGLNQQRADSALVVTGDLCAEATAKRLIDAAINWHGRLDALVNNASLFLPTTESANKTTSQTLFDIHVHAPQRLSDAARPLLAKQEGVIINITDTHADKPLRGYSEYCQSKAALAMQTRALAQQYAPSVRVNAVAPGAVCWPEGENTLCEARQEAIIKKTWLKKHGKPQWVAQAVLCLVQNPFVTGQTLKVDGGRG